MPQAALQPKAAPLIFISHKHSDREIATAIRTFINERTLGKFRVFQSSDAAALGPKIARELNTELMKALWEASAIILLYTTADKDWSYCMWECGVATKPDSPPTRIIVFQCSDAQPVVYSAEVFVDARTRDGLAPFVTQFLTDPDFLPDRTEPLTDFHRNGPEVGNAITKFHSDLAAVLPKGNVDQWPAHPFARLEIPAYEIETLRTDDGMDLEKQKELILSTAQINWADSEARRLLGLAPVGEALPARELIARWRQTCPKASDSWIDELVQQIVKCARWQFPALQWTQMQTAQTPRPALRS